MLLTVVGVYQQGRKLSEAELRAAPGVIGDVRTEVVQINGKAVRQVVCMGGSKESLPPLIEPQLTGISPLALGLEGYEEVKTPEGIVLYVRAGGARCGAVERNMLIAGSYEPALGSLSTSKRNFVGSP